MRILSRSTLSTFWNRPNHKDSETALRAWFDEAKNADWSCPQDIKTDYRSASFVGDRVVFNIAGNKYRLIVYINYPYRIVYIRFIGTHKDYDQINVKDV